MLRRVDQRTGLNHAHRRPGAGVITPSSSRRWGWGMLGLERWGQAGACWGRSAGVRLSGLGRVVRAAAAMSCRIHPRFPGWIAESIASEDAADAMDSRIHRTG